MATYTNNYNLKKPTYAEPANVMVINENMDMVDDIMHSSQVSLADAYDLNSTYNTGDKVMYELLMYKCLEDDVTGAWDSTKWERTTAVEGGVDVDEKFQTGLNVADIDVDEDTHSIKVPYMTGATSLADGTAGLPPAPQAGDEDKFFKGDGTWGEVISGETIYGEASGAIASFSDGSANPLADLKIAINPVQAGSGDPSPSNPRPISGWTGANVTRDGKNLFDDVNFTNGYINNTTGEIVPSGRNAVTDFIRVPQGSFTLSNKNSSYALVICFYDLNKNYISRNIKQNTTFNTVTIPNNCAFIRAQWNKDNAPYVTITTADIRNSEVMLSFGDSPQTYEPYNGTTYPITWQTEAGTVYVGEMDVTSGVLTVTHANIASYNGESINEPWLSSMDVYQSGATPTTGAQVVYPLITPTEITLTSTQITSLLGTNNIWSNTGEIEECVYQRDLNLAFNELWNAVFNQSNARSLSMIKSVKSEDTDTKEEEIIEEETEKEIQKEIQKEGNDENQR